MELREYQKLAFVTANMNLTNEGQLANAGLGLAGESGEVADIIKKHLHQGHELDKDKLIKELGDVLWYVALACTVIGVDMSDVAEANIAKLKARYPGGFEAYRSINRLEP